MTFEATRAKVLKDFEKARSTRISSEPSSAKWVHPLKRVFQVKSTDAQKFSRIDTETVKTVMDLVRGDYANFWRVLEKGMNRKEVKFPKAVSTPIVWSLSEWSKNP